MPLMRDVSDACIACTFAILQHAVCVERQTLENSGQANTEMGKVSSYAYAFITRKNKTGNKSYGRRGHGMSLHLCVGHTWPHHDEGGRSRHA